jgi:RNase H-fold protein (predicted Holliday junction resolvase)
MQKDKYISPPRGLAATFVDSRQHHGTEAFYTDVLRMKYEESELELSRLRVRMDELSEERNVAVGKQMRLEGELQASETMVQKLATRLGDLIVAFDDEKRTTRIIREQNETLNERIQALEFQLNRQRALAL